MSNSFKYIPKINVLPTKIGLLFVFSPKNLMEENITIHVTWENNFDKSVVNNATVLGLLG